MRERLKREIGDRVAGLVEPRRGRRRVGSRRARQRAESGAREVSRQVAWRRSRREWNKDPADAAFDLVSQGTGRVMAIYHMMSEPDIETALRFPWTSIGSDAGAVDDGGRSGSDRADASPRLRQLPARDRAATCANAGADARGGDSQDDVMAGDAHAPRRSRRDPSRRLGRRRHLRLREAAGSRDVRRPRGCRLWASITCWSTVSW